jgi:DNA segregation ATPase FtsK/SpoIIIE-like protein
LTALRGARRWTETACRKAAAIEAIAMNDNELPSDPHAKPGRPWYADSDDALYPQAVALVRQHRRASISWLQRQLNIGFNTALRMIERMERDGIVAPSHPHRCD